MTPRERAIAALTCKIPDQIPTFELEFQLTQEYVGKDYLNQHQLEGLTQSEIDKKLHENAEFMLELFEKLEYSIIPIHYLNFENQLETARIIRKLTGNKYMLTRHGDGTYGVPDGNRMYDFAYRIADDPAGLKADAERMANNAIESNKRAVDAGFDSFILCADYCYNTGPFLSPVQFREYITPYLHKIIKSIRENGAYAIKHTDGDIMPILDQLAECEPHALHSLDPMARVDIKEVKRLVGDKICLAGNVNCALMQTGTDEEVIESAEYAITHGKPNGGYIFTTSNCPFRGLPLERYLLVLDVWKKHRDYHANTSHMA
jgi:uroporphyrinogen decarboxylase